MEYGDVGGLSISVGVSPALGERTLVPAFILSPFLKSIFIPGNFWGDCFDPIGLITDGKFLCGVEKRNRNTFTLIFFILGMFKEWEYSTFGRVRKLRAKLECRSLSCLRKVF